MASWREEALVVVFVLLSACRDVPACPARCECTEDHVVNCGYQRLTSLPQNIPDDAVNLYLHHNNLQHVPRGAFRSLRRLEGLALTYNRVASIEPGAFEGLTNLQSLYLGYNLLTNISADIFRGLSNLDFLVLNGNVGLQLDNRPFVDLRNLGGLYLGGVGLRTIPNNAFRGLSRLWFLGLSRNNLTTLSREVVKPLISLRAVGLADNPLTCNCELLWLRKLVDTAYFSLSSAESTYCTETDEMSEELFVNMPLTNFTCKPPKILSHTVRLDILEGDRAALRCEATGDPDPVVMWRTPHGDYITAQSSLKGIKLKESTLVIRRARPPDSGYYTCIAGNSGQNVTVWSYLNVTSWDNGGLWSTTTFATTTANLSSTSQVTTVVTSEGRVGLSLGGVAIALIALGLVCICCLAFFIGLTFMRLRRKQSQEHSVSSSEPTVQYSPAVLHRYESGYDTQTTELSDISEKPPLMGYDRTDIPEPSPISFQYTFNDMASSPDHAGSKYPQSNGNGRVGNGYTNRPTRSKRDAYHGELEVQLPLNSSPRPPPSGMEDVCNHNSLPRELGHTL